MAVDPTNNDNGDSTFDPMVLLAPIVAFLILLAFGIFVIYMLGQREANETQWTRLVYIFTGVESIAFAAAGFFLGSEIRREQTENADERADEARTEADAAKERASNAENRATEVEAKGKALAAAIKAETAGQRNKAGPRGVLQADGALQVTQADFEKLEALAEELFPR